MRIALYARDHSPEDGGVFSMQSSIVNAFLGLQTHHELFVISSAKGPQENPQVIGLAPYRHQTSSLLDRVMRRCRRATGLGRVAHESIERDALEKALQSNRIDLVWFVGGFEKVTIPYVFTVLDLEHRKHPMFPEINYYGWQWEARERVFSDAIRRASWVITGTEFGRKEVLHFYAPAEHRVRVIPLPTPQFALDYSETRLAFPSIDGVSAPYIFYPAQGWPHKDHMTILRALTHLPHNITAVFCGAEKENTRFLKREAKRLQVDHRVHFVGFQSTERVASLYQHALALVFPCLFGPDNLPPLEAGALRCPAVCAAIPGATEQLGDRVLYFDPCNDRALAEQILTIERDRETRSRLIAAHHSWALKCTPHRYAEAMLALADELTPLFRCWDQTRKEEYR